MATSTALATAGPLWAQQQSPQPTPKVDDIEKRLPTRQTQERPADVALPEVATTSDQAPEATGTFMLVGVNIVGATAFSSEELGALYEPYIARDVAYEDLAGLAQAITDAYRNAGYFLSRAIIPPQDVSSGVLTVQIIEGYLTGVDVSGAPANSISRYFNAALSERPLQLRTLERALSIVGDIHGLQITGSQLEADTVDAAAYRLVLDVKIDRLSGLLYADNRGTRAIGKHQLYVQTAFNSLFRSGDQLQLGVFTTPDDFSELIYGEASYALPVHRSGTLLNLFGAVSRTEAGDGFAPGDIESGSKRLTMRISQPLVRGRRASLWARASFDFRDIYEDNLGTSVFDDRLRVARFRLDFSKADHWQGLTSGSVEVSKGLTILDASDTSDLRSRFDADSSFAKSTLEIYRSQSIGKSFGLYTAFFGQYASGALLLSEEYSHGGSTYGRAFDFGELTGEHAAVGLVELRFGRNSDLSILQSYQAFAYYDVASVWNETGAGQARQDTLSSAGGGVRLTLPKSAYLSYTAGKPLADRPSTGGRQVRHFFSITTRF